MTFSSARMFTEAGESDPTLRDKSADEPPLELGRGDKAPARYQTIPSSWLSSVIRVQRLAYEIVRTAAASPDELQPGPHVSITEYSCVESL